MRRRAISGRIGQIAYDIVTADRGQTQQAQCGEGQPRELMFPGDAECAPV